MKTRIDVAKAYLVDEMGLAWPKCKCSMNVEKNKDCNNNNY